MLRMLSPRSLFVGRHSVLVIVSIRSHGAHALDALDISHSAESPSTEYIFLIFSSYSVSTNVIVQTRCDQMSSPYPRQLQ